MASLEDLSHEELLVHARRLQDSDNLFKTLVTSPDTREDTLRLMKKKNPNLVLPEIDAQDKALAAVAEERKKREELENKILDREIRDRIAAERARVAKQYELTDADVLEVEKLMTDKDAPIPSYDGAAKVFKASRTASEPTPAIIGSPTYDMPDPKVWSKGIGNTAALNRIFLDEATKVYNEGIMKGQKAH